MGRHENVGRGTMARLKLRAGLSPSPRVGVAPSEHAYMPCRETAPRAWRREGVSEGAASCACRADRPCGAACPSRCVGQAVRSEKPAEKLAAGRYDADSSSPAAREAPASTARGGYGFAEFRDFSGNPPRFLVKSSVEGGPVIGRGGQATHDRGMARFSGRRSAISTRLSVSSRHSLRYASD